MNTFHSMESTTSHKIVWAVVILLAATVAACGGSTHGVAGTAPSLVSPVAGTTDGIGSFDLLKEGKGKGHAPLPEIGTTPEPDDPEADDDAGELGPGHGHGKAAIQYEGFTTSIVGSCPDSLTITFNEDTEVTTITTDPTTEFQRAKCDALLAAGDTPVHVHIAARKLEDDSLVAIYVRVQGPKGDDE
jgi:hypothetical protein